MKSKDKKKRQTEFAKYNINFFFSLLDKRFYPDFDKMYIRDIKRLSQAFNIRLTREQKLKFCNKCNVYWTAKTREIRLNSKTKSKDYTCKNCGYTRKFRYK